MAGRHVMMGLGVLVLVGGATAGLFAYQAFEVTSAVGNLDTIEADTPWTSTSKKTKKRRDRAWKIVRKLTNLEPSEGDVIARLDGEANTGLEGAMVALGDMGSSGGVPKLIEFLKGEDERKRKVAGFALSRYKRCPKALTGLLTEELAPEVRQAVYAAMAKSNDSKARLQVADGLKEADPAIRKIAVKALGKNQDKAAHAALVAALEDESDEVGDAVVKALSSRSESTRDNDARKALRAMVKHERPEVRGRALAVCAATYEEKVAKRGEKCLDDPHPGVAAGAALLMEKLNRKEAAPALVKMLVRTEPEVVEAATKAIRQVGGTAEGTDEQLLEMLSHTQLHTRTAAATLIAYLQDLPIKKLMKREPWVVLEKPYVPKLIECLGSGDAKLTEAAHNALSALQSATHFANDKRDAASWNAWHAKLKAEEEKMEQIWDICDAANDVYQAREATKYKVHVKALRNAVRLYEDLIDMGSKSNYEHGDYGIKTISEIISIMNKTSKGF